MNYISYAGQNLKIIRYPKIASDSGYLYRVDKDEINTYNGASIKFFALTERNTNSYAKNAKFLKKWEVKQGNQLILLDILDIPTREALAEIIGHSALNIAFPIRYDNDYEVVQPESRGNPQSVNNAMYMQKKITHIGRYSNSNPATGNPDYDVLKAICSLGIVDGYYMEPVENFHSEIGLCGKALSKLKLVSTSRSSAYIPPINKIRKTRSRIFNGGKKFRKARKTRKLRR
jgi:hypothetical protein